MSYYLSLYGFSTALAVYGGFMVYLKYKNPSGFLFFASTFFASIWFVLYFLFFSGIPAQETLLPMTRLNFLVGIYGVYSLLGFIHFFSTKPTKIFTKEVCYILGFFTILGVLYLGTDWIIAGLFYEEASRVFREIPGKLFALHIGLHLVCIFLFFYLSFKQLAKQTYLNRIRLRNILTAAFFLIGFLVIFQLILPTFGVWILEKEVVFSLTIFVLYINFTINRYYFSRGYNLGRVTIAILSIAISLIIFNLIKSGYLPQYSNTLASYWKISDDYMLLDPALGMIIFAGVNFAMRKLFLGSTYKKELKNKIQELYKSISHATSFVRLNMYTSRGIRRLFKTNFAEIVLFPEEGQTELQQFFENNLREKMFINDLVFLEENKAKFNTKKILAEIPEESFLILPIYNREEDRCRGALILGIKKFGDFYDTQEIEMLQDFVFGLGLYIKYIKTYAQIRDLSINLDKRVDEKTMEYNHLINRQKEFISIISHEIKSPLSTAIFQADSMLDDLENDELPPELLKSELTLLNNQLIKTGELISTLFSVQYFETHSVSLFRENVQISYLLQTEFDIYCRVHEHITFINKISNQIGFASIDRIQLQQVITNILGNAVKFLDKQKPMIMMEAQKIDGFLHIAIEDNGKGFEWIDAKSLFEKYTTFGGESSGLGMGLYLCKRIVEMHDGEITAGVWQTLGWARFTIRIPVQ